MSLTVGQVTFLQRLVAEAPEHRREGPSALLFVEHHRLGQRLGRSVVYTEHDHRRAASILTNHGLPLTAAGQGGSRADMRDRPGLSEKSAAASPHDDSVAVKTAAGHCTIGEVALACPPGAYAVLTRESARAVKADVILVVENLETFRWLDRYLWLDFCGANVLAIYRGDRAVSVGDALEVVRARSEQVWTFSDFDPAGLGIAASMPRLQRLMLPDAAWLEVATKKAERYDLFADQLAQNESLLDRSPSPDIQAAWRLLKSLKRGFPQEWMQDYRMR